MKQLGWAVGGQGAVGASKGPSRENGFSEEADVAKRTKQKPALTIEDDRGSTIRVHAEGGMVVVQITATLGGMVIGGFVDLTPEQVRQLRAHLAAVSP